MNRFFISGDCFSGEEVVLAEGQAHQIRGVLRMSPGDHIIVLDNEGFEYEVVLTAVEHDKVAGRIAEKRRACGEPQVKLTLYQSLLSREKFEWVLQKCTEVGAARFVPMIAQRSIVRDAELKASKLDRWRRIITEAAEQSGRGRIPELAEPVKFEEAVSGLGGFDRCLVACPKEGGAGLRELLGGQGTCESVAVFIGPEGGFTEEEVNMARRAGAMAFSLGRRILRTETAAVVATALILYELGQD